MKQLTYGTKRDHLGFEVGGGSFLQFDTKRRRIQATLKMDYNKTGDGILWAMQRPAVLKSEYSYRDRLENKLYNEAEVLEDGETVEIVVFDMEKMILLSRKQYKFKALGDYSDCAVFEEI